MKRALVHWHTLQTRCRAKEPPRGAGSAEAAQDEAARPPKTRVHTLQLWRVLGRVSLCGCAPCKRAGGGQWAGCSLGGARLLQR